MNHLKPMFSLLTPRHVKAFWLIQILLFVTALFQVGGVASLAPFLALLSNTELIFEHEILQNIYVGLEFESTNSFLVAFACLIMALIVTSNAISAFTLWFMMKFSMNVNANIQKRLYGNYLASDYEFFSQQSSSRLTSRLVHQVPRFTSRVFRPMLHIASQSMIALLIIGGLLYVDYIIALSAIIIITSAYLILFLLVKSRLTKHGDIVTQTQEQIMKLLSESFGGIKDIKLRSLEPSYNEGLRKKIRRGLDSNAFILLAGDLPRFLMESAVAIAILSLAIYLILTVDNSANIISILGLYAIAGFKLLPAIQTIYKSVSSIKANSQVTTELLNQLNRATPAVYSTLSSSQEISTKGKPISLEQVAYKYPEAHETALDNLNMVIHPNTITAFVGASGAGKSTAADIILGLLPPNKGRLLIQDTVITKENVRNWQSKLGYVSQSIFIADDNFTNNIAFGSTKKKIDMSKIIHAAKLANLHDFIESLPNKYNTHVGEYGSQLSGGQKQRIGIARALYHDTEILIFDEATSALDNITEAQIMNEISNLSKSKTIIIIAHRLSTIINADNIVFFKKGRIAAQGSFQWLLDNNKDFNKLVKSGGPIDPTALSQ